MNFKTWCEGLPVTITDDPLWKTTVYQQALFLGELSWYDVNKLAQDRRTLSLSDQLYRATGSISANISEGYSRASGKDQARFYEYALGSTREARDWYYKGRHVLNPTVSYHRMSLLVEILRQLLAMIPKYRQQKLREEIATYQVDTLQQLLNQVPMPD
jgi:four helix bundle protein